MEDLNLKMQRLNEERENLLKQKIASLAQRFMHDNIDLLLDCYTYDYSGDIWFYEEMDHRFGFAVKEFKEDIAPDYTFINKFMACQPLVGKLKELDIEEKSYDTFLFKLENYMDENHFFTRLQLHKILEEKFQEGILIEDVDQPTRQYYFFVVLPEDEDFEEEKNKLSGKN